MVDLIINIVGYTATVVGTFLMLPQIIKSLKTKQVRDVSSAMTFLYSLNCLLWLIYGVLIVAYPVIAANFIGFLISLIQIIIKIKYS
ncbi:MAG: SemiSWEET family transporter [Candidatus Pacearchaeota archaeon]|nr:SemiSWEET family transporter [Candidatus Pacearchaeota archaeon]